MISRIWHGWTDPANADAYEDMLRSVVLPEISERVNGYLGVYLLRRDHGQEVEFVTVTMFATFDAVRSFAGDDYEETVIAQVQRENDLDQPIVVRYGYWVRDAFTNSFGKTILGERPIFPELKARMWVTLQLIVAAQLLSLLIAVLVGVYSAIRQYSFF